MKSKKFEKNWCGCPKDEECQGHTVPVVIDGKVQPHLNSLDVLKYVLDLRTGKLPEPQEITV